jgi:hypothetical protein
MTERDFPTVLEELTGESIPFPAELRAATTKRAEVIRGGLGYSQLNELLLTAGLDRITKSFFSYLANGSLDYRPGMSIEGLTAFDVGVQRFRRMALLLYGNVKFAFKSLSRDDEMLLAALDAMSPKDVDTFSKRHPPLVSIEKIEPERAYLTGYLIQKELADRIKNDPTDKEAQSLEKERQQVVERAELNQAAYLTSDHLDVYVATSMRAKHEFVSVARLVGQIFESPPLKMLKLRYFDPTQAYCANRIDKGLSEALMLKRAACTIYLAQESDTLGKDSELASTLAQGKPVVAFVPKVSEAYLIEHFDALARAEPSKSERAILLDQLRIFDPAAAWTSEAVREWCRKAEDAPIDKLKERVYNRIRSHYDGRAKTLMEAHPLGIQVNLETGVANGVLVVRTVDECAEVVARIVTGTLQFTLDERREFTALKESVSGCIFRVMTADKMLTNTFWNFYLRNVE